MDFFGYLPANVKYVRNVGSSQRFNGFLAPLYAAAALAGSVPGQQTTPDNTRTNHRDRDPGAVTAVRQKRNKPDSETAWMIPQSGYKGKSLPNYAQRTVPPRGPVCSQDEKTSFFATAVAVAGGGKS